MKYVVYVQKQNRSGNFRGAKKELHFVFDTKDEANEAATKANENAEKFLYTEYRYSVCSYMEYLNW